MAFRFIATGLTLTLWWTSLLVSAQPITIAPTFFVTTPLGNPPSADPLVDPNPLFLLGASQTVTLSVDIRSVNFAGVAYMAARCVTNCSHLTTTIARTADARDLLPSRDLIPDLPPNQIRLRSFGSASATMTVTSTAAVLPSDAGAFLIEIEVRDQPILANSRIKARIRVPGTLVLVPADATRPACASRLPATPEILPLAPNLNAFFASKRASPARVGWSIGVTARGAMRGWMLDVVKPALTRALAANETLVVFFNNSSVEQSMYTVNLSGCGTGGGPPLFGNSTTLKPGQAAPMILSSKTVSTIVLSDPTEAAIAIFSDPPFWTLFGGRQVTITAVQ